jgi:hypothetical protein
MREENSKNTTAFRWLGWILNVFGHYLLFSPIISLMSWIPLVGFLLSGALKFAAILFSLLWATIIHFLVLAISWIVYRPYIGCLLLLVVATGLGLCFI